MIGKLLSLLARSVTARWVTGFSVTLLLGGSYAWWHSHKQNLREEGIQECVQEINQATVDALEIALADEREATAKLAAELELANQVNARANDRRNDAEARLLTLQNQMDNQRDTDPDYKAWSDTDLPDGVADRLRQAAGGTAGRNDSDDR